MQKISLLILIVLCLYGCEKLISNKCSSVEQSGVGILEKINEVNSNEKVEIKLCYTATNSCVEFDHFENETRGFNVLIKSFFKYELCDGCFDIAQQKKISYYFKERKTGTYYLEFQNPNSDSVWDTIVVK